MSEQIFTTDVKRIQQDIRTLFEEIKKKKHAGIVEIPFANGYMIALIDVCNLFIKQMDEEMKMDARRRW